MSKLILLSALSIALSLQLAASDEVQSCTAQERSAYHQQLTQAIHAAWQVPNFDVGYSCTVIVALNFRGEVLNVGVEDCSRDDAAIRKSIEDAAYDASPLPLPANRSCLDRTVRLRLERRSTD